MEKTGIGIFYPKREQQGNQMRELLNNERGSGIYITMFYFVIVGIALILIFNVAMIFIKKEQASNAAEQASFAATRAVYDEVNAVVAEHVKKILIGVDKNGVEIFKEEPLSEKVAAREQGIRASNSNLSSNEIHIQAVNEVLLSEIPDDGILEGKIISVMNSVDIQGILKKYIKSNHGKEEITPDWDIVDYRIEVIAKSEFEAVHYNGIQYDSDDDIPQKGIGPKISFLQALGW